MIKDRELQQAVLAELNWEPRLAAGHIGVTAEAGIVTLTGHVASFQEKQAAEEAASRVRGVKALVQNIEVRLSALARRPDDEVAAAALERLAWDETVPDTIHVTVRDGWVTLTGEAPWHYQKVNAERDVAVLRGVVGVTNTIRIVPSVDVVALSDDITHALHRSWFFDPQTVQVTVEDGKVLLRGTVSSEQDRRLVASTAWNAPGVVDVINELIVVPSARDL
jgi:osmotically-inducible protein OsmY